MRPDYDTTKRHILDAGQQIIAVKGFAGVGLSEILTAADIPKGSFYHYFGSKEQYGCALIQQYFDDYFLALEALFRPKSDLAPSIQPDTARERLMKYWRGWQAMQVSCSAKEKCLVVKLSAEVADLSDDMRQILRDGTQEIMTQLAEVIAEGIADGSLSAHLDPDKTAQMLYQMWLGASLLAKLQRNGSAMENAMLCTTEILRSPPNS